jgi:hypothetical protein
MTQRTWLPPGHRTLRGVLIAVVACAFLALGYGMAVESATMVRWVAAAVRGVHQEWLDWNWHLW